MQSHYAAINDEGGLIVAPGPDHPAYAEETNAALAAAAMNVKLEDHISDHDDYLVENPELPPPMEAPMMEAPMMEAPMMEAPMMEAPMMEPMMEASMMDEETCTVTDPLADSVEGGGENNNAVDPEQAALDAGEEAAAAAMEAAAAAEAAEACLGNVLDDVHHDVHHAGGMHHNHNDDNLGSTTEDDEVALAAAAAAAAVQAADGMAVVVDQALLATAAAAAASQVAEVLADQSPTNAAHSDAHNLPQDVGHGTLGPPPFPMHDHGDAATQHFFDHHPGIDGSNLKLGDHGELLEQRREKDRKRYSAMTPEARASYNAHRRALYHKQGETARKRRRERERDRYHSLEGDAKKHRNDRRAKLERDRYNRQSKNELATRNSKRRERAKVRKQHARSSGGPLSTLAHEEEASAVAATATIPPPPRPAGVKIEDEMVHVPGLPDMVGDDVLGAPLPEATVDVADAHAHAMADASALAAEVAEQVIAGANLEGAMQSVAAAAPVHDLMGEDGPTVQI